MNSKTDPNGIHVRRALLRDRICFCCGASVPNGAGVVWPSFSILVCAEPCQQVVHEATKDRSRTAKGKFRKTGDVLRLVNRRSPA